VQDVAGEDAGAAAATEHRDVVPAVAGIVIDRDRHVMAAHDARAVGDGKGRARHDRVRDAMAHVLVVDGARRASIEHVLACARLVPPELRAPIGKLDTVDRRLQHGPGGGGRRAGGRLAGQIGGLRHGRPVAVEGEERDEADHGDSGECPDGRGGAGSVGHAVGGPRARPPAPT
jgi:hypothetical protein